MSYFLPLFLPAGLNLLPASTVMFAVQLHLVFIVVVQ
uniref:Uncharacterized protein n=1 Tax=Arundo donax TaxID=35708 RepID=A0A0A9GKW7_ARUDO